MSGDNVVTLTINGREVQAAAGRTLIDVAEELNVFVPRFCYHPGMKSVAVCRMCLVHIEGQRKLQPACSTPVTDGMVVNTREESAVDAQEGMLEFLLINHPLDCPICDRGGECPLQDQTYKHGPGSSRYIEPKRTYEKALAISDLVVLDRERCVLCWRCVRFSDEIAGDAFIQLVDRGPGTQILNFSEEPFDSYFSGNTIQICPVGALTSKPYRFVSRPWDLKSAPSVCAYCSVGCPITNESRSDKLVRCQALPNENVNDFWICDKGRFGYHYVDSEERLTAPLIRDDDDEFTEATWGNALDAVASKLRGAGSAGSQNGEGAKRVGIIAGGHLTTEDAWAISKLAKEVLKTPHIDSRIQDAGAPYERTLRLSSVAGSTATINDLEGARTIVWVGPDPKETLPVLFLKLRKAVLDNRAKLIVVSPRRLSLDVFATHVVRTKAGQEASAIENLGSGATGDDVGDPLVVCWGPSSPGRDEAAIVDAIVDFAAAREGKLLVCPPHAGSQGLIDMGVHPLLDAGHSLVDEPGMDTRAILQAAAAGELDALLLFGADLITDFPDAELAERALDAGVFTVSVQLFATETAVRADVLLPSTAYAEREGTFTNLERRIQKLEPLTPAPGVAREPWRFCASLARTMDQDWGWHSFDDVWADIRAKVPTHGLVDVRKLEASGPTPAPYYESGFEDDPSHSTGVVAGPGGQYPKGHRSGTPFQTGQNWPLSWELRGFEARQRPGIVPAIPETNGPPALNGMADRTPHGEDDGFVLYTGRLIYDDGTMVSKSSALHHLARRAYVELNEHDAKELGLSEGDEAVLSANGSEASLEVRLGDVARGAVFVPYDPPGFNANILTASPRVTIRRGAASAGPQNQTGGDG
ncbi:MAG: NADH-quinone oxidoreductase subunit NuoG [Actinomycetota bacterium]